LGVILSLVLALVLALEGSDPTTLMDMDHDIFFNDPIYCIYSSFRFSMVRMLQQFFIAFDKRRNERIVVVDYLCANEPISSFGNKEDRMMSLVNEGEKSSVDACRCQSTKVQTSKDGGTTLLRRSLSRALFCFLFRCGAIMWLN